MAEIKLVNAGKSYGNHRIFENLNIAFKEGKITAVMGRSGLGKTTIIKILLGLTDFEGSLEGLEGLPGAVFQENRLMPWLTVKENIRLFLATRVSAKSEQDRLIFEALELVELTDAADKKPESLSGGMQRRAALARCIAAGGDFLVLDEPFTGLDEALKDRIAGKLAARWKAEGQTVIFITHDSSEAEKYADEIINLQDLVSTEEPRT